MPKQKLSPKEKLLFALQRDKRFKFRDLRAICGVSNETLNSLLWELRREGYRVVHHKLDRTYSLSRIPTPYSDSFPMGFLPKHGVIGLISDTHLCSDAERLDLCEEAYDLFASHGITTVLHAGDISDGWNVYRNHKQFVKCIGGQNQARYVIRHYPHREGLKTFFIGGNHDLKAYEESGLDTMNLIVQGFEDRNSKVEGRKDLVYLGQYSRYLTFPDEVTVHMLHPRGNNPYAKSYAQQKRARDMDSATRPDIQISGHMHTWSWIREDFCQMLALPGLQDQTEFFVRLGFSRQMGCVVLEYQIRDRHIKSLQAKYHVLE